MIGRYSLIVHYNALLHQSIAVLCGSMEVFLLFTTSHQSLLLDVCFGVSRQGFGRRTVWLRQQWWLRRTSVLQILPFDGTASFPPQQRQIWKARVCIPGSWISVQVFSLQARLPRLRRDYIGMKRASVLRARVAIFLYSTR